jgi:hypothetical protein
LQDRPNHSGTLTLLLLLLLLLMLLLIDAMLSLFGRTCERKSPARLTGRNPVLNY